MSLTWLAGVPLVVLCWAAGTWLSVLGRRRAAQLFAGASPDLAGTVRAQLSGTFLNRVLPANGGLVAAHAQLLRRHGVPAAELTASLLAYGTSHLLGHLIAGMAVTVLLLAHVVDLPVQLSVPFPDVAPGLALSVAAVVAGLVVLVPAARRALRLGVRHLTDAARLAGRRPGAIAALSVFEVGTLLLLGLALFAALRASGSSLSLPMALCVLVTCNLLAGAVPAPGGAGPVDLALVGALTSTGVPGPAAITAVAMFRLVTHWLPVPLGLLALGTAGHAPLARPGRGWPRSPLPEAA